MKLKSVPANLARHGVHLQNWGMNGAWSVADLQQEIASGFSELVELSDVGFVRRVLVVELSVFMFRNGVMENLRAAVPPGNKMTAYTRLIQMKLVQTDQKAHLEATRHFLNSIGIRSLDLSQITPQGEKSSVHGLMCTPGLKTQFLKHCYAIEVPMRHYSSDGYKCWQGEQQYVWVAARKPSSVNQFVPQLK